MNNIDSKISFKFTKMNGLGNSFILMDDTNGQISNNTNIFSLAINVCDRNFGIGADGLILVRNSETDDYKMTIINQDGTEAEMCGNGIRCFAKFAFEEKITDFKKLNIETLAGTIKTHLIDGNLVKVNMGKPIFNNEDVITNEDNLPILINANGYQFSYVSMGNPHAISFIDSFDFDWRTIGANVEKNEAFPHYTNVEFAKIISSKEVVMKVWERGCGETMACGTGACALVVAGVIHGLLLQEPVIVYLPGGDLEIFYKKNSTVMMTGAAETVCRGTFFLDKSFLNKNKAL